MVESGVSRVGTSADLDADFSNHRAFNCRLAVRVDSRSSCNWSRSGNTQAPADHRHAPVHTDSSRGVVTADPERPHWFADGPVYLWRFCDFFPGPLKLDLPPFH